MFARWRIETRSSDEHSLQVSMTQSRTLTPSLASSQCLPVMRPRCKTARWRAGRRWRRRLRESTEDTFNKSQLRVYRRPKPESGATYRSTSSRASEENRYGRQTSGRQKGSSDIGISPLPIKALVHIATYVMARCVRCSPWRYTYHKANIQEFSIRVSRGST
jgi:hypothetical protein